MNDKVNELVEWVAGIISVTRIKIAENRYSYNPDFPNNREVAKQILSYEGLALIDRDKRPHYATHIFKDDKKKHGRHYLYWGRCWCGYKAEAYGKQLVQCKLHGYNETIMQLIPLAEALKETQ